MLRVLKIVVAVALFAAPFITTAEPRPAQSSILGQNHIVLPACDPALDSDLDGVDDCTDLCPDDTFNTEPDVCGCGFVSLDVNEDGVEECVESCSIKASNPALGYCQCPLIQILQRLVGGGVNFCPSFPVFDRNTKIKNPPGVVVVRDTSNNVTVQIYLQKFSGGVFTDSAIHSKSSALSSFMLEAARQKLKIQYDLSVRSTDLGKEVIKKTLKRNQLTISSLGAGNYSAKYRVVGTKDGEIKVRSKYSPRKDFVVPE